MQFFFSLAPHSVANFVALAKSLDGFEAPEAIEAPSAATGDNVILLVKAQNALRNNPRLQRKKVLVHGQGHLFYAERLVAPTEQPRLVSLPTPSTPKPPRPAAKPLAAPVAGAAQQSLEGWSSSDFPVFKPKPKQKSADAGTLALPLGPPKSSESSSSAPSNFQGLHEPKSNASRKSPAKGENSAFWDLLAQDSGDGAGHGRNASPATPGPVRSGIREHVDPVRTGDSRGLDQGRDAGQSRAASAGSDERGNSDASGTGPDPFRSDERSDPEAPATTDELSPEAEAAPPVEAPPVSTQNQEPRPVPGAFLARTTKTMQAQIERICAKHGVDLSKPGAHLRLEQKNYDPLVIENIGGDRVSVAHYFTQNGDLMADPEIVYFTRAGLEGKTWAPIEITQAPMGRHVSYAKDTPNGIHIPPSRGQADLASFSSMWARNIKSQGWLSDGVNPKDKVAEAPEPEPQAAPEPEPAQPAVAAQDDVRDKIGVDEAHHYEDGHRVRGATLDDEVISSQSDAAPEPPAPAAQTFDTDQTADVRAAGIGQGEPDGETYASTEPLHQETPQEVEKARRVRGIVARGLSAEQKSTENDLVLTDEDNIGKGSLGQKASDNFAALDLLKTLEVEDRIPTEEEKKALAHYVGWGAFGQAFQDAFSEFAEMEWDDIPDHVKRWRFSNADKKHFDLYKKIKSRLTEAEFSSARASIKNAHYTAPGVVKAMYSALEAMGFSGGRVCEPSCGTGNFLGFMPPEITARSKRVGVELDQVTGKIARLLYPGAQIHIKGFEEAPLADNSFDLCIGNVPFGDYGVVDHEYVKQGRKYQTAKIHNYFFSKALDKTRAGGVVAFITSAGTLDAKTSKGIREAWADKANFLGAIRLPNDAFEESAGTKVTTDIIFLQKKDPAFEALHPRDAEGHFIKKWAETVMVKAPSEDNIDKPDAYQADVPINEYFAQHPEMMMGRLAIGAGLYRADSVGLVSDGRDLNEALQSAVTSMMANLDPAIASGLFNKANEQEVAAQNAADEAREALSTVKPGAFYVEGDDIFINRGGRLVPLEADPGGKDAKKRERIKAQYRLLEIAREHLANELGDETDETIAASRADLNQAYDEFTKAYGDLHARANVGAFSSDPDAGLLLALEHVDKETGDISKADVFFKRTITPYRMATTAESATDALGIVLGEVGELDWQRMSELLDRDPEGIRDELAAGGLIFRDPDGADDPVTAGWLPADAYLSGEVKKKLEMARAVAEVDPTYAPNIAALEAVQPEPLLPSQVEARLGAPWVPANHINEFMVHMLGRGSTDAPISFSKHSGWVIVNLDKWDARRDNAASTSTWGTKDVHAVKILEATLNMKDVTVMKENPFDPKKRQVDAAATLQAREKQAAMKNEWRRWIESDPQRHQELADLYNNLFNTTAPRAFDGSHLTFPGMNAKFQAGFRQHAKNAVWRAIQTGNCLFDHVVGAGKTGCVAATAMELRRLNLAKKPMVVVRNPQLEQWEREFREIYPNAKLLVINEGMGNAQKRKELCAKIATGDWDAVIMAQSTFKEIPASPKLYADFISEQLDELRDALNEEKARALASGDEKKRSKAQKQIETTIEKLQVRLKSLEADIAEHQDNGLMFDELGIDALLVDEAHDYKNLMFTTRMGRIAGLNASSSEKAMDMFVKSQDMLRKNKGRGLIFATGTPVSNTLAEMWTMKRYLMLPKMKELGFDRFDTWAATFGDTVTSIEKAPEGGFRSRTRFAKFVNVPEMVSLYRSIADVKTRDDLKDILPTPKLDTGAPIIVTAPASPALTAYMDTLQERAKELQTGKVDPKDDNFLKITSDGRKAALDLRLLDPTAPDDPHSKVNQCVKHVARIHGETRDRKATQLVFLDLGTPKGEKAGGVRKALAKVASKIKAAVTGNSGDEPAGEDDGLDAEEVQMQNSVYADIKAKLIAQGVPEREIAFAHDFKSPAQRREMSRRMDTGDLSVVLGSTSKMGVGLNVQKRLFANHHLDCPWKPGELEQRDGRILRQGNLHHESEWDIPVQIYRYGTQNSFDEYMWQAVAKKAAFIAQTRQGECARTCEDMDETVMTASSMQAALSDNPLMGEKAQVDSDVFRFSALRKAYLDNRISVQRRLASLPAQRDSKLAHAADREAAAAHYAKYRGRDFAMTIHGVTYADREAAGNALATAHEKVADLSAHGVKVGSYNGFDILARFSPSSWDAFNDDHGISYVLRTPDGKGATYLREGNSGAGTTTKIDNVLKGFGGEALEARRQAAQHDKEAEEYKAVVNVPFEHQRELDAALKRQGEIDAELAKGGDADAAAAIADGDEKGEGGEEAPLQKSLAHLLRANGSFNAVVQPIEEPSEPAAHRLAKALTAFRAQLSPTPSPGPVVSLVDAAAAFSRVWNDRV